MSTSLVSCLTSGDYFMKLYAKADLTVDNMGCVRTVMRKEDVHCGHPLNTYTSGLIKYLGLPEGTRVRLTLEVIEDGDGSQ